MKNHNAKISIFDMNGKQVHNEQFMGNQRRLDVSAYAPGVYFCKCGIRKKSMVPIGYWR